MLWIATLLAIVATASASSSSSCVSVSVPSVLSTVTDLPFTIESVIASAYSYDAEITTIGEVISTIELTNPSISYAEYVIASYEQSYSTLVAYISAVYGTPSLLAPSSVSSFSSVVSIHSTLASALSTIVYIESLHPSLAVYQSALETIEVSEPSVLTYLSELTYVASPTLYVATESIEVATITSPYIVVSAFEVGSAVYYYPSISSYVYLLTSEVYYIPSPVVTEIVAYLSSPSIVSPSIIESLASCYPSVYSQLTSIVEFTYSHSSIVTALTDVVYAASTVQSLLTDVSYVVSVDFPTLSYQTAVISAVSYVWPTFSSAVDVLEYYVATSSTLAYAISTLEDSIYESSSVATLIISAIESPSTVTEPTEVSYDILSHQSLASAVSEVASFGYYYQTFWSYFWSDISSWEYAFASYGTVVTAESYVNDLEYSSYMAAGSSIESLVSVVSSIVTVVDYINYVTYAEPSLSCYEEGIESYAYYYPYYASYIWEVENSPSLVTSSFSWWSFIEDEFPTFVSDVEAIVDAEVSYPAIATEETYFISGAEDDASLLSDGYDLSLDDSYYVVSSSYVSSSSYSS